MPPKKAGDVERKKTASGQAENDVIEDITNTFEDGDGERLPSTAEERAQAQVKAFLSGASGLSALRKFSMPADLFPPGSKRAAMLKEYNSQDVYSAEGLLEWQIDTIDHVLTLDDSLPVQCNASGRPGSRLVISKKDKKKGTPRKTLTLSEQLRDEIAAAERKTSAAMLLSDDDEFDVQRHFQVAAAFAGSDSQTGLNIEDSRLLLGMTSTAKHSHDASLDMCSTTTLDIPSWKFLDLQVTGAAWMLQHSLGYVPNYVLPSQEAAAKEVYDSLRSLPSYGGVLADVTGTGKTSTAGLFMTAFAKHMAETTDGNHRPILLLTMGSYLFDQWSSFLYQYFPGLDLILGHGDKPGPGPLRGQWVSKAAMQAAPLELSEWPPNLRHVFDQSDPRASRTVLLVPYDTWAVRSLDKEWVPVTDDNKHKAVFVPKFEEERVAVYESRYTGVFSAVIADEGHKLRHEDTLVHRSVKFLESPIHWFLTATPQLNDASDIVGLLALLWPKVKKTISQDATDEQAKWLDAQEDAQRPWEIFDAVQELEPSNKLRNIVMDPNRVWPLLRQDTATISRYFTYIRERIFCQRSTASSIPWTREEGSRMQSLGGLMPEHKVTTVEVSYNSSEAGEAQYLHRLFAREYAEALETPVLNKTKKSRARDSDNRFPPIVRAVRRLNIVASSTLVSRLDLSMSNKGFDTLVEDMRGYRSKDHDIDWFIRETRRPGDITPITTRRERLKYLCWGSPKLRLLLRQVRDVVLHQKSKLLVTEDTPIVAWFFELVLQFFHVKTYVLHSDLSSNDRRELIQNFNSKESDLSCLIIMYGVPSLGINMHGAAHHAFVATGAINAGMEMQAWGRLVRISQKHQVNIVRCQTANSHDQYRDSQQLYNQKLILATASYSTEMRELLVTLLNEGNAEVKALHKSPIAELLRRGEEQLRLFGEEDQTTSNDMECEESGQLLAKTAKDNFDVAPNRMGGKTVASFRQEIRKMNSTEREKLDQRIMKFELMLRLDPDRVYHPVDLEDMDIHDRALVLLHRARFGQAHENVRLTPHIHYDALHPNLAGVIEGRVLDFEHGLLEAQRQRRPSRAEASASRVPPTPRPSGSAEK
ncbi:dna repair [Diplodia corticola]|uniref:Dna repair n=1 Tax=Diplodia corticola TaxID=236234 RepID=A0A1J9R975_9PEZI|nr:dna repair [Diplodia corticola]OJD38094.1 dna repair [Diplodia corticola]